MIPLRRQTEKNHTPQKSLHRNSTINSHQATRGWDVLQASARLTDWWLRVKITFQRSPDPSDDRIAQTY